MRKIEIIDDVKLRFPAREAEFDVGVEVGALSVLMAQGIPTISREISSAAVEQLRPIAERFRYMLSVTDGCDDIVPVTFSVRPPRPQLRLVSR